MQWLGKAIGGLLGFAAAGPIGSLLGAFVGHQFDQGLDSERRASSSADTPKEISRLFFAVTFEAMGHVAKIDGRVSEEEVRVARRIMHAMQLSPEQVRVAIDHFTAGKSANYPLAARLSALGKQIGNRRDLPRAFVEIQMQAAIGAGEIGKEKRQLLWRIASALGVGRVELAQIEALARVQQFRARSAPESTSLDAAYRVLGVEATVSDEQIKTAYRRLMNQHHPDKLVSRGLPESMAGIAKQRTLEIRAAYERIKESRGFR